MSDDQPSNATFPCKIESIQYNASLAITGVISDLSRENLPGNRNRTSTFQALNEALVFV